MAASFGCKLKNGARNAFDALAATLDWRLLFTGGEADASEPTLTPLDFMDDAYVKAKTDVGIADATRRFCESVPLPYRVYKDEDGGAFYMNLLSTQVPRLERGLREVDVPNALRSVLSSTTSPSEATPVTEDVLHNAPSNLLGAGVPSDLTPLRAMRPPVHTGVSAPRRGNRLFLKDLIFEAVAAVSCLKCSDGLEETDCNFASSTIEQHGYWCGLSAKELVLPRIMFAVRFCPPCSHSEYTNGTVFVVTLTLAAVQHAQGARRDIFCVRCSCDQAAELLAAGVSSGCDHATNILAFLWPLDSEIPSRAGAHASRILHARALSQNFATRCSSTSENGIVARVADGLLWRKTRRSRKAALLVIVEQPRASIPVIVQVFCTRAGKLSVRHDCQCCDGEAGTRGRCDHEITAAKAAESAVTQTKLSLSAPTVTSVATDAPQLSRIVGVSEVAAGDPQMAERLEDDDDDEIDNTEVEQSGENFEQQEGGHVKRFISKLPRSPFPCLSQLLLMDERSEILRNHDNPKIPTGLCRMVDLDACCWKCGYKTADASMERSGGVRTMIFQSFAASPALVVVQDWLCPNCGGETAFDGACAGVFSTSRTYLWCRSLLDSLAAGTLRYSSSGRSTSGQHSYWHRETNGQGCVGSRGAAESMRAGPRQEREAVAEFIGVLGDAPGRPGSLSVFFFCFSGCELPNGAVKGLIVDGTAIGIRSQLLPYNFPTLHIPALATEHASVQFVLRKKQAREAVRYLCRQAQAAENDLLVSRESVSEWEAPELNLSKLCGVGGKRKTKMSRADVISELFTQGSGHTSEAEEAEEFIAECLNSAFSSSSPDASSGGGASLGDASGGEKGIGFSSSLSLDDLSKVCELVVGDALRATFHPVEAPQSAEEGPDPMRQATAATSSVSAPPVSNSSTMQSSGDLSAAAEPSQPSPGYAAPDWSSWNVELGYVAPSLCSNVMRRSAYAILLSMVADPPLALLAFDERLHEAVSIAQALIKASLASGPAFKECLVDTARTLPASVIGPVGAFVRCIALEAIATKNDSDLEQTKLRDFVLVYSRLILCSCLCCVRYEEVYQKFRSPEAAKFEEDYACNILNGQTVPVAVSSTIGEAQRTGHCYPGRRAACPGVRFSSDRKSALCSKEYPESHSTNAGLIMTACICPYPIVPGFSVMPTAEALGMIWTVLLVFFGTTPLFVYDSGCNLFSAVSTRMLWALKQVRILLDRFHGMGHVCGPGFSSSANSIARSARTSSVESLNGLLKLVSVSLLYVRPSNYIPFVTIRLMFANLCARWRFETGRQDVDTANLTSLGNRLMPCGCSLCKRHRQSSPEFVLLEKTFVSEASTLHTSSVASRSAALADYYRDRQHLLKVVYDTTTGLRKF